MSAGNSGQEGSKRAAPDSFASWNAFWAAQGMAWRTEPEIDEARQRFLANRRAVTPNVQQGIYPFRDEHGSIALTRSDVEWLLETHESGGLRGPIDWNDQMQRGRQGLDLRGADVRSTDLARLPLDGIQAGLTSEEYDVATAVQCRWACTDFEQASLYKTGLRASTLRQTQFTGANLREAHLEAADLAHAVMQHADLRLAFFDEASLLTNANLEGARLADVRWNSANLSGINWARAVVPGDERDARSIRLPDGKRKSRAVRLAEYEAAVRACRQLSTVLAAQGLDEVADRFGYRSQVLQRHVLLIRGRSAAWYGSLLYDLVAGYGYKPTRLLLSYVLVVYAYAMTYYFLSGNGILAGPSLTPLDAIILSIHVVIGHSLPGNHTLTDPLNLLADSEVIVSVAIGLILANAFGRRYFGR